MCILKWDFANVLTMKDQSTYVKWKENSFNISQIFTIFSTIGQWFQLVNWKCFLVIFFNGVFLIWVFILDIFISFYLHCLTLSHKNHTCIMKGNNTVNSKVIIRFRLTLLTLHIFIFFMKIRTERICTRSMRCTNTKRKWCQQRW